MVLWGTVYMCMPNSGNHAQSPYSYTLILSVYGDMGMNPEELRQEMGDEEYFQMLEAQENERELMDR